MLESSLDAIRLIFQLHIFITMVVGTIFGIIIGCLPGLTPSMGVALLIPLTFGMAPLEAIVALCALYCGGMYGGAISAILIGIPGTGAAAATVIDGYEMTRNGQGGKALGMAAIASCIGGTVGVLFLLFLSGILAGFTLQFGPAEYFSLGLFGLTIVVSLSSESLVKGLIAGVLGVLISTIGIDNVTGVFRFTFDVMDLISGIHIVPVIIGLFAVTRLFDQIENAFKDYTKSGAEAGFKLRDMIPSFAEMKLCARTLIRSSWLGTVIGVLPGAGGTIASFICYNEAKRFSKTPEKFGTGFIEGVAATEAANNAASGGAMIPLMT